MFYVCIGLSLRNLNEQVYQAAEKVALLTCPTPVDTSPARPEPAKTVSLPRDAPFPMPRSRIALTNRKR